MVSTAILGYKALSYLNYIAVPALIILSIYGVVAAIQQFGVQGLIELKPSAPFSLLNGIAIVVGGFAVGAAIAADYSRYNRNRTESLASTIVGVLPMGILLVLAGGVMAALAGTADITAVVASMDMPVLGLIILILATWTTNAINAYSGGLALTSMFRLSDNKRALTTAIAGIIGTVLALAGILNNFIGFLTILTAGICPLAGVMIADYWIRNKGRAESWSPEPGVYWPGLAAWRAASAISYFVTWGITAVNGIVSAIILYLALSAIFRRKSAEASKDTVPL
jgi:cytosine permease